MTLEQRSARAHRMAQGASPLLTLLLLLVGGCAATPSQDQPDGGPGKPESGALTITCRRTGVTREPEWSSLEVELQAAGGVGAIRHHNGRVEPPSSWRGLRLHELLASQGFTVEEGEVLVVIARDGYRQTLTRAQLGGKVATFDAATGRPIDVGVTLEPILALSRDGAPLPREQRRLVWIGERRDIAVDGTIMVRDLATLAIAPRERKASSD